MRKFKVTITVSYKDTNTTTKLTNDITATSEKECDKRATRVAVLLVRNRPADVNINIKSIRQ